MANIEFDMSLFIKRDTKTAVAKEQTATTQKKQWQKVKEEGFHLSYELSDKKPKGEMARLTAQELQALEKAGLLCQTKHNTVLRAIEAKRFFASNDEASAAHFSRTMIAEKGKGKGYSLRTVEKIWAVLNRCKAARM